MINMDYAKLDGGYPIYAPNPIELTESITIDGITHPVGALLSLSGAAKKYYIALGYKPVIRESMPRLDGHYYTETWAETETEIVQEWEEHEQPPATDYTEVLDIMTGEKA